MMEPVGFSFPFRVDPASGGVAMSRGDDKIRENLLALLQTELGERVLRRDYGAGLRGLIHEPIGGAFQALLRAQIAKAVTKYEPRIGLVDLAIRGATDEGQVEVVLMYVVRRTQQTQQVVLTLESTA